MIIKEGYPKWIKEFEVTPKKTRNKVFEESIVWNINIDLGVEFCGITNMASYTKWLCKDKDKGVVEYFPKSDKIHVHSEGSVGWYKEGLKWIYNNMKMYK